LENAPNLAAYYAGKRSRRAFMTFFHAVMPRVVAVDTHYQTGAEAAIEDHLDDDKSLFVVHKHQHFNDPMVLGTMMQRESALRPMRHHSRIAARMGMFKLEGSATMLAMGWFIRHSRAAVPVIVPNDNESQDSPAIRAANDATLNTLTDDIDRGHHVFMYPEGSRHEAADLGPDHVWPFFEGMGRVVTGVARPEDLSIMCIGTSYHQGTHHRRATSYVTTPQPVTELNPQLVVASTRDVLQYAQNQAAELARST